MVELARTRDQIIADPNRANGQFVTITEWRTGAKAVTHARGHAIDTDEPTQLGGDDAAMDPMELLLAALGSCIAIGWVKQARHRDVALRSVRVSVEAPYDLRGYFDIDSDIRPGFGSLNYHVEVDCDADDSTLAEIMQAAENTSPLFDNLLNSTPVNGQIHRIGDG